MRVFESLEELSRCAGQEVAVSAWVPIAQERIDRFAEATDDRQWIHVDRARAAEGPFGCTIAHGFLTLSLLPHFFDLAMQVKGAHININYGLNRVRFIAPVRVESALRARFRLLEAAALSQGETQLVWDVTVECRNEHKPVCVAEFITLALLP